jgi:predicted transcriptional regulator
MIVAEQKPVEEILSSLEKPQERGDRLLRHLRDLCALPAERRRPSN